MKYKIAYTTGMALIMVTCSLIKDPEEERTLIRIADLPADMQESSGITEYQDLLWSINDSGNEPAIHGYNKRSNTIERKLIIDGAANIDWEEITQDDNHLYIGDFGNNYGDRHDLRIYIIDKSALQTTSDTIPFSGLITYNYEDQTDFTPDNMNTPFDCEAFIAIEDSLVLFTKDWRTEQTSLYTLPAVPGDFTAHFRKKFNAAGLVTAAAYSTGNGDLLLLGYRYYTPFIHVVHGFRLTAISMSNSRRIDYFDFSGVQTEGIAYSADGSVYVSSELSPVAIQTLYRAEI